MDKIKNTTIVQQDDDTTVLKTPDEIRKTYPNDNSTEPPKFSAEQMAGDPEEFKREGATPAQGDNNTADDEVSDDGSIDLRVD